MRTVARSVVVAPCRRGRVFGRLGPCGSFGFISAPFPFVADGFVGRPRQEPCFSSWSSRFDFLLLRLGLFCC